MKRIKIGYSCWGFLGNGIIDTPDGGRSHRSVLIRELINQGAKIIMLQKDRDRLEAKNPYSTQYLFFDNDFPDLDALFIEYRWPILGRNLGIDKKDSNYTPDLDRQNEIIEYYKDKRIPILIWDKDQKLKGDKADHKNMIVFEPSLYPGLNRKQLLFPIDPKKTQHAFKNIASYSNKRKYKMVYIGNQYERDEDFKEFIDVPASILGEKFPIFGNWDKYPGLYKMNLKRYPNVDFRGRLPFGKVAPTYNDALTTCLIAPERYYHSGQFTQRLFECLWQLCIPLTPNKYKGVSEVIIKNWIADSGSDLSGMIDNLSKIKNNVIKKLFIEQLSKLNIFNSEKQAGIILTEIRSFYA